MSGALDHGGFGWPYPALAAMQEATWPPAEIQDLKDAAGAPVWRLRWTDGAGRRAASARPLTSDAAALSAALPDVAAFYRARSGDTVLQLPDGPLSEALALSGLGYSAEAPTCCLAVDAAPLAARAYAVSARPYVIEIDAPVAALSALWRGAGIGAARQGMMARAAQSPHGGRRFAIRLESRLAGAAFIGLGPSGGMLHALTVAPRFRRRGVARDLIIAGARYVIASGGPATLMIDVEQNNAAALSLYEGLGAAAFGRYRYYRRKG